MATQREVVKGTGLERCRGGALGQRSRFGQSRFRSLREYVTINHASTVEEEFQEEGAKAPSIELRVHRRSATRPSRRRPHAARETAAEEERLKNKKKRKPQASTSEHTEDPQPDQADDNPTQSEKLCITVNKRAWDVFQDALFLVSTKGKKPKQIPWADFVHAMTSLGFNMMTIFGSVRRFEPGEKAKPAGLRGAHDGQNPQQGEVTVVRCF